MSPPKNVSTVVFLISRYPLNVAIRQSIFGRCHGKLTQLSVLRVMYVDSGLCSSRSLSKVAKRIVPLLQGSFCIPQDIVFFVTSKTSWASKKPSETREGNWKSSKKSNVKTHHGKTSPSHQISPSLMAIVNLHPSRN